MAASGARVGRRVVVTLLVVVVLLVVADRVSAYVAERAAGNSIESSQHLDSRPDVNIAGFPFLTQLATGKYDKITITANDVPVGQRVQVHLSALDVVLHTVTVSHGFSRVHSNAATATASIDYADLGRALGVDVGYAGRGRIKAAKTVTAAGRSAHATVVTTPKLVDGALAFGGTSINDASQFGAAVTSELNKVFDLSIPLQGIPFHVRVRSLTVDPKGIQLVLAGRNLSYTR
jgi:hypothetical protein